MSALARPVLLLLTLLACSASTAHAAEFAFSDNSVKKDVLTPEQSADLGRGAGASVMRVDLAWDWVEFNEGQFDWRKADRIYWSLMWRGMKPLWVLGGAPQWARSEGQDCVASCHYPPAPERLADWAAYVRAVAERYPQAAGFEIWNEPNHATAWRGGIDPEHYTTLLKAAYEQVQLAAPHVPVISGGLAGVLVQSASSPHMAIGEFFERMYRAGAVGHFDAIGIHAYPEDRDHWRTYRVMSQTLEARDRYRDRSPLWITELGVSTSDGRFTEAEQSTILTHLWARLRGRADVQGVAMLSMIEDDQWGWWSTDRGYGLVRREGLEPKPAYCMFARFNGTDHQCPLTVARPRPQDAQVHRWDAQMLVQAAADAARVHHSRTGTYRTVTSRALNAIDSRISSWALLGVERAGAAADPARVLVKPLANGGDGVTICNASRADKTYCILLVWAGQWNYGATTASVADTAAATERRSSGTW